MSTGLWNEHLNLPKPMRSKRISRCDTINAGEPLNYEIKGKGCVKHCWFTYMYIPSDEAGQQDERRSVHNINLKIYFDGVTEPAVNQPLDTFFGTFLDEVPVEVNSAPITVLKRSGFNSWFPMPFSESCSFVLTNNNEREIVVWFMADVHFYGDNEKLTDLRFGTRYVKLDPAPDYAFMEMADINGKGFIAGIFHGTDARCQTDSWYHTGGDTWLIDGEEHPGVIRGNGGEDLVGYSFGIYKGDYLWQGAPYIANPNGVGGGNTPCVFYRFFGPDAIMFNKSIICKFGTKEARIETNVYYYSDNRVPEEIETIKEWDVCGPFDGTDDESFQRSEFPEYEEPSSKTFKTDLPSWQPNQKRPPEKRPKPYVGRWEHASSKRGYVDFLDFYRGIAFANYAAGGKDGAAYALGWLESDKDCTATLDISYDDRLKLWINDELVHNAWHDDGFTADSVAVKLVKGKNKVLLKLSNAQNSEFFAWAFHISIKK